MSETVIEFVKESKKAGKTHGEIREALQEAGWTEQKIGEALERFVDRPFPVAIPRAVAFGSPRLVFLNIFFFLILYLSIYNVIAILFTFLDYYLPDGLGRRQGAYFNSYQGIATSIRWYLASTLCYIPCTIWINRIIKKSMEELRQSIPRTRLTLAYLTMFVGGCVMLGNVTCGLYYFISGEIGIRFTIKVAILTTVVVGLFSLYGSEIKQRETKA